MAEGVQPVGDAEQVHAELEQSLPFTDTGNPVMAQVTSALSAFHTL